MSDGFTERVVQGRWSKRDGELPGFVKFEIDVEGLQWPLSADTKREDTVASMMALRDQDATFTLAERPSKNTNPKSGKPYTDRYVSKVVAGFVGEPSAPAGRSGTSRQRSPEETRSIIRQSCLKAAAALYTGRENATSDHVIGAAVTFEAWVLREDAPEPALPDAEPVPEEFRDIPF